MLENTKLFFLEEDILKKIGKENGKKICLKVEELYDQYISTIDFQADEAVNNHLITNLFPTMAYYNALRDSGCNINDALSLVREETQKASETKKSENQKMLKMPFTYLMYRLAAKGVIKKSFPYEAFETKWICCNSKEIHFDFHKCIYNDLTKQYGCPELCTVFCENDDITFSGLMPKIRFERTGTLGQGMDKCDFHLIKNKRK